MPAFNPNPWNTPSAIPKNNCYNYALDRLDHVVRNPGDLSGNPLKAIEASIGVTVAAAACEDGLVPTPLPLLVSTNDLWTVALVTAIPRPGMPHGDYHWIRNDSSGAWSQKMGRANGATDLDESGKVIGDPFAADRGEYLFFVGFFIVYRPRLRK